MKLTACGDNSDSAWLVEHAKKGKAYGDNSEVVLSVVDVKTNSAALGDNLAGLECSLAAKASKNAAYGDMRELTNMSCLGTWTKAIGTVVVGLSCRV